jgi:hypothetical protein
MKLLRMLALSTISAIAGLTGARAAAPELATAPQTVLAMHADGIIEIGTDGSVEALQFTTPLAGELKPALERNLRALRFKPVKVDGQAIRARSGFTVYLAGERVDKGLRIKFDGINFAAPRGEKVARSDGDEEDPTPGRMGPPNYPKDLLMSHLMADVQLALLLGGDGRVEDVRVVRTTMVGSRLTGNEARRAIAMFEKSALAAARKWTANVPGEFGARPPERRTAMTAVVYTIPMKGFDAFAAGQWVEVQRSPKRPVDWLPAEQKRAALDRIASGGGSLSATSGGVQMVEPLSGRPVM